MPMFSEGVRKMLEQEARLRKLACWTGIAFVLPTIVALPMLIDIAFLLDRETHYFIEQLGYDPRSPLTILCQAIDLAPTDLLCTGSLLALLTMMMMIQTRMPAANQSR